MNKYEEIDTSTYHSELMVKTDRVRAMLTEGLELPEAEIFSSKPINYRMRAEFNIFRDGPNIRYFMVEKDGKEKKRVFITKFAPA